MRGSFCIFAALFASNSADASEHAGWTGTKAGYLHGMSTQSETERKLFAWAHANELSTDLPIRAAFCEDTSCRGLVAARSISKDEVVISIPQKLLMNLDTAFACPLVQAVWEFAQSEHITFSERQVLVLHLIIENRKGTSSFWHPFLSSMPLEYDTLENWQESTVAHLQFPALIRMATLRRATIQKEYQQLQSALAGVAEKLKSSADSSIPRKLQAGSAPSPSLRPHAVVC
jgi:hypothetical protein